MLRISHLPPASVTFICVCCFAVLFLVGGCSAEEQGADALPGSELAGGGDADTVENRGADTERWWDALPRPEWSAFERVDDGSGWFEVYRVQPEVLAIYEPGQFEEVVSYLIIGGQRALLFDTGLGIGDIHRLATGLTELPVVVLNSHSHYDHIGGNHQFDFIYGPDHPYTRERSRKRFRQPGSGSRCLPVLIRRSMPIPVTRSTSSLPRAAGSISAAGCWRC